LRKGDENDMFSHDGILNEGKRKKRTTNGRDRVEKHVNVISLVRGERPNDSRSELNDYGIQSEAGK